MNVRSGVRGPSWPMMLLALPMAVLVALPMVGLLLASSPSDLVAGIRHPAFAPAFWLSARTTLGTIILIIVAGTPLSWWLATAPARTGRVVEVLVELPIVIPPAVVGIALLETFGRSGLLGPLLSGIDVQIPFTTTAVVLAQVVVAAPFYVLSAAAAFRRVDPDLMIVARTLGQTRAAAFVRVAVPLAAPGLIGGIALAWARALGEFGATLLFAGNLPGSTQTMPLAIYTALESDIRAAVALALVLAAAAVVLLVFLRWTPGRWSR